MKLFLLEGIKHIEDLPIHEFITSLRNIEKFNISEKLDGVNIVFGFDENGKFYLSREGKGGQRFYSEDEWEKKFWATGFRAAHVFLQKISPYLKSFFTKDSSVEAEILFGATPNTVPYSIKYNYVVLLKPFHGKVNISGILEKLGDKEIKIKLSQVPVTKDGKTIEYEDQIYTWKISGVPKIDLSKLNKEKLKQKLEKNLNLLENYLNQNSGLPNLRNIDVLLMKLNVKPKGINPETWETYKEKIKQKREEIEEKVLQYKLLIKEDLLNEIVRKIRSKFGEDIADSWIEGVVFHTKERGEEGYKIFKLVDKNFFTAQNKFNWKIRETLSPSGFRKWNSLNNKVRESIKKIVDPQNKVNINRKPKEEEIIEAAKVLQNLGQNIESVKEKIIEKILFYIKMLDRLFDLYSKHYKNIKTTLKRGSEDFVVEISDTVHKKNLEAFAELRNRLILQIQNIKESKDFNSLVYYSFFN